MQSSYPGEEWEPGFVAEPRSPAQQSQQPQQQAQQPLSQAWPTQQLATPGPQPAPRPMPVGGRAIPSGAPRAARGAQPGLIRRRGVVGWWLDLTGPPRPSRTLPVVERERLRKAELTSFSILAVFLLLISLVSNSLAHPSTAQAVIVMALGLFVAAVLNRVGWTRTAAYLVPSLLMLVIAAAILRSQGGLQLALLPAYDLFALPVLLVSLTASRRATWVFAVLAVAFVLVDFALQPHARITAPGAVNFDDIQYAIGEVTWWGGVNRHVALILFAAFFSWLGAWSVEAAILRADRAEEVARLEHFVADQKRQLDIGIRQILDTHIRAANGDFNARVPASQDNVLWQIAASLNNLLARLQKTGRAEHQLRRTEDELRRLGAALDDVQMGRRPLWPAQTGTAADLVLTRVVRLAQSTQAAQATSGTIYGSHGSGPLGPAPSFVTPAPRRSWPGIPPAEPPVTGKYRAMPPADVPGELDKSGVVDLPVWLRQADVPAPGEDGGEASWPPSQGQASPEPRSRTAPTSEVPLPPWLGGTETPGW